MPFESGIESRLNTTEGRAALRANSQDGGRFKVTTVGKYLIFELFGNASLQYIIPPGLNKV